MHIVIILAFVVLLVVVVFPLFLPRKMTTFSPDEMKAFRHAEAVKKELGEVQAIVGPAKAPYTLTLGGSYLPAPPKKPETEAPPK